MSVGGGATGSLSNKGMRMNAYNVDLDFNTGGRLSVIGNLEFADNHYKKNDAKSYLNNIGLAGGLGYTFLKQKNYQLRVVGKVGSTIDKRRLEEQLLRRIVAHISCPQERRLASCTRRRLPLCKLPQHQLL